MRAERRAVGGLEKVRARLLFQWPPWQHARCRHIAVGGAALAPDARLAIQHIIASHHGRLEYGALKRPATPEAIFVSRLDDLDAATRIALDAVDRTGSEAGGFTEPVRGLGDVRFYRPRVFDND